ncbi:MAG: DUF1682 domain-containing protein [Thermoproteota archaeon]|jgi:hypothetical protein|nr:DUF1682 domain-containing protein [Thermoproteota archaeon]
MKKGDPSSYYDDRQLEHEDDLQDEGNFSGPGVTEFSLDLDTDKLRNMSPEELEKYLRMQARKRLKRNRQK